MSEDGDVGLLERTVNAFKAGYDTFVNYNLESLAPLTPEQWDNYNARLFRYDLLSHYYHNTIYTVLEKYRARHLKESNHGLYKRIRPIRNPYRRGVNSYPAYVYGGQIDMVALKTGAIPFVFQNNEERLTRAILRLFEWSNMQQEKDTYVRRGAMLGDSAIKVVDDREKQKVQLEFLHPSKFKEVEFDNVRNVQRCTIAYWKFDERGKRYWYEEKLSKTNRNTVLTQTFRNEKPFAFYADASGKLVPEWEEPYPFIPVRFAMHMTGDAWFGMSMGHGVLVKIDELNAAASATHDQIGKIINPIWKAKDVEVPPGGLKIVDDKGTVPIVNVGAGDLEALTTQLQIADALQAIRDQYDEIKADMPELALAEIREHGNLTFPGVNAGWQDAIGLVEGAMGNYDASLVAGVKMAITIGGVNGYRDFEGFNASSYDNGEMDFNIKPRSVVGDTLSKSEKINFLIAAPPEKMPLVMQEMGYGKEEIAEATSGLVTEQESQVDQMLAKIAGAMSGQVTDGATPNGTEGNNPAAGNQAQVSPVPAGLVAA